LLKITAEVVFIFVELDPVRREHLEKVVSRVTPSLPATCKVHVVEGAFDERMMALLNHLDEQNRLLAPAFVMVDPFGVAGTPMSVLERILANPRSEVYVSFMYESINRFKTTPEFAPHLDSLFGCDDWRDGLRLVDPDARKRFFFALYAEQLRKAGAKHVVNFELFEGDRLIYAIFFGTQNVLGCDRMKQAIWKVAPWGTFQFRGSNVGQATLGIAAPDFDPLVASLKAEFGGRGFVSIDMIVDFVSSERTDYHSGHVRSGALVPMERAGEIEVDPASRKRARTYPRGTRIHFP
jgi:three-Cys-motif partner protein